jgi:hypothetical protein
MALEIDPYEFVRAEVLLAGYSARWEDDGLKVLAVEQEFDAPLINPSTGEPSKLYRVAGKMDAIVEYQSRQYILEHKSSSEDLTGGSIFWKRQTMGSQISMYYTGMRSLSYEPSGAIFDVLGKPAQRPSQTAVLDEQDLKIVLDANGERVRTKDGKKWRQTADTEAGFKLQTRQETPEEFRKRLFDVIGFAPGDYFVRGDIVRLQKEEEEAAFDIWLTVENMRIAQKYQRYPRNPSACMDYHAVCTYFPVCTREASIDDPTRYRRTDNMHEELSQKKRSLPLVTNSEISTFRQCHRLWHYRYELGYRALKETEARKFGTLIHRGLEGYWLRRASGGNSMECYEAGVEMMRIEVARTVVDDGEVVL